MKYFILLFIIMISSHCSFDTKSGIWKSDNINKNVQKNKFEGFKTLNTGEQLFSKVITPSNDSIIKLGPIKKSTEWNDQYYNEKNSIENFKYDFSNDTIFKSKKLSKYKINERILYNNEKIIFTNDIGDIVFYSFKEEKITFKYNFYKKKFKNIKKKLFFIYEKNILYIADNIGYLYAIDNNIKKVIWAQNFKVPFRSNIKIKKDNIFISNQNNVLFKVNKLDGEILSSLPTEEMILKNNFINSLALNDQSLFYLNNYGSLYAIQKENFRIKWFINLNQSLNVNPTDLFSSKNVVLSDNKIIISTDPYLYVLNSYNGATLIKKPIPSISNIITSDKNLFLISENNLLVCIDMKSNKIVYSLDLNEMLANYLKTKKKTINIKYFSLTNNNLILFLNNYYAIQLSSKGLIKNIEKLKEEIQTVPIFIDNSLIYFNKKNKLIILN